MRLAPDALAEILAIVHGRGAASVHPDEASVDARVDSDAAAIALLELAVRMKFAVRTRLFPFGADERGGHGDRPVVNLDLSGWRGVVEHSAADFTATVRAGTALKELQDALAPSNQWLPIDPPAAGAMTIGEAIAKNEWGPRRTGLGTIRDHLLGARCATIGGRVVKTGGAVVKSATGYDLHRLQVGALETLAVLLDVTVRLRPRPESTATLTAELSTRAAALETARALRALTDSPTALFVLDPGRVVVRYEGSDVGVRLAAERAATRTPARPVDAATGDALLERARSSLLEPGFRTAGRAPLTLRLTCRPSTLAAGTEAIEKILMQPAAAVLHPSIAAADLSVPRGEAVDARRVLDNCAGIGNVRLRRPFESLGARRGPETAALALMRRLKELADPDGLLNPGVLPYPS